MTGVKDRPVRLVEAERAFADGRCDDKAFAAAAHAAKEAIDEPNENIHAPAWVSPACDGRVGRAGMPRSGRSRGRSEQ